MQSKLLCTGRLLQLRRSVFQSGHVLPCLAMDDPWPKWMEVRCVCDIKFIVLMWAYAAMKDINQDSSLNTLREAISPGRIHYGRYLRRT